MLMKKRNSNLSRRKFLGGGALAAAAITLNSPLGRGISASPVNKQKFNMKFAPHIGMFMNSAGKDPVDQLKFMGEMGFTAFEDNGMLKRPVALQERMAKEMQRQGIQMGVFVVDGGDNWKTSLATGRKEFLDNFLQTCHRSVEVAKRVNAKWMTVVPGFYQRKLPLGIQTSNVIEALRRAAEIFEPHGLVMVLEPLSDTPDLFLRHTDQAFMICRAVNSPSCKILFDIYHMQRKEGQIISNIDLVWEETAYFQIGDNPGRKEPTTGEINYKNIFKHIHDKGYTGILGMEHGNSMKGKDGEEAVIQVYRSMDISL